MLFLAGPDEEGNEGHDPEDDVEHDEHADVKSYVALLESQILDDLRSVVVGWQWREVCRSSQSVSATQRNLT